MTKVYRNTFYILLIVLSVSCVLRTINHDLDFKVFYNAARQFIQGNFDFYNIQRDGGFTYKYGPVFPILFSIFGLVSLKTAQAIWGVINALSFIVAWIYSEKFLRSSIKDYNISYLCRLITLVLMLDAITLNAIQGNINVFIFMMMIMAAELSIKKKDIYAAILVAVACSIKIIPGVIALFFLLNKNKRAFIYFIIFFTLFFFIIPISVYGTKAFEVLIRGWITVLSDVKHFEFFKYNNQSPYIIAYRVFNSSIAANFASTVAILGSLALLVWSHIRGYYIYTLIACFFAYLTIPNTIWTEYHLILLPFILLIVNMLLNIELKRTSYILLSLYFLTINVMTRGIVGKATANLFAFYGNHLVGLIIVTLVIIGEADKGYYIKNERCGK